MAAGVHWMYECRTIYDDVAAGAAAGSFAVGVRQSVSAGARGVRAGGARRRIRGRRAGVELPRGASGTSGQCVAHRGETGAGGGTAWRAAARGGRGARAGFGVVRRCGAAIALPAVLSEILRGGVRQRAVQPGSVAVLQRVSGGLAAVLRDRGGELQANGIRGTRSRVSGRSSGRSTSRFATLSGVRCRRRDCAGRCGNPSSRTICGGTGARCTRAWASSRR